MQRNRSDRIGAKGLSPCRSDGAGVLENGRKPEGSTVAGKVLWLGGC